MAKKYCRAHLLTAIVFLAVALVNDDNLFFLTFPCIFMATVPTVLLSYDERCKWDEYCGTLPCSKKQFVSEKYLVGLIVTVPFIIITAAVLGVKAGMTAKYNAADIVSLVSILLVVSVLVSAVTLPFMIKLGVEKGRIAYYVMIGAATALAVFVPDMLTFNMQSRVNFNLAIAPISVIIAAALYVLSWKLSVRLYENREL